MNKVVVTGGAGFIGSNLADELARTYRVFVLDDLSTGQEANVRSLLAGTDSVFVNGSILDLDVVSRVIEGAEFVFHQAAMPSVSRSIENPLAVNEVNVRGTLNVLVAARDAKVKKVVFASSSSVYGDTAVLPKEESMIPCPMSPYAATKIMGEYYCQVFQRVYGLPTACLRYFNVYGPRQNPFSQYSAVIPKFIVQLTGGQKPTIYGDGEQTRDFTFVKDAVQANIVAAESEATGVMNVGTGSRISLNQLTNILGELTGARVSPAYQEARRGDVRDSLANIERAKSFGYVPRYTIKDGLRETISSISSGDRR